MKVGIITFHYNNNFGAALQCYALQQVITSLGHEVEIIDYVPKDGEFKPFWKGWHIRGGGFRKKAKQRLLQLRYQRVATAAFSLFREKYFSLSERCSTVEEFRRVGKNYDAIICGSDQVWVFDRPSPYFLDLGDDFTGLRISYAACCGHDRQRKDKDEEIGKLLKQFDSISVRNDFSKAIISPMVGKDVSIVADPTLLSDFDSIQEKYPLPFKEYILIYALSADEENRQFRIIKEIRKKVGNVPVVSVVANSCPRKIQSADLHIYDAAPGQWIELIKNAAYVYTDSFHGALFCLKYGRDFIADYKEQWRSLRLLDVAQRYGFDSHVAGTVDETVSKVCESNPNYENTKMLLHEHASKSVIFLEKSLKL
jgi:hypothetical protein